MTEQLLAAAIAAGQLRDQPLRPLATVLLGALDEAAMSVAESEGPARTQSEVRAVIHDVLNGILARADYALG